MEAWNDSKCIFIGCLPQVVLLAMDSYRGVTTWDFVSFSLEDEDIFENNDALFKFRYGNTLFAAISSFLLFFLLSFSFLLTKYSNLMVFIVSVSQSYVVPVLQIVLTYLDNYTNPKTQNPIPTHQKMIALKKHQSWNYQQEIRRWLHRYLFTLDTAKCG